MQGCEGGPDMAQKAAAKKPGTVTKKPGTKSGAKKKKVEQVTRTCNRCGTQEKCPEGSMPSGWSLEVTARGNEFTCAPCLRGNLRAIEAKLPQEYWEW